MANAFIEKSFFTNESQSSMSLEQYFTDIRNEFPQLNVQVHGHPLVYLDSAATALKPRSVIQRLHQFNQFEVANIHRGAHFLGDQGTKAFEETRESVRQLLNTESIEEIIFTKGTTESVNLVATSFGESFLNEGDEILLTEMEHHANLVPWQMLAQKRNLKIHFVPVLTSGELDLESFQKLLNPKIKLFAVTACSNTLGTINQIEYLISEAKKYQITVLIDGAQIVSYQKVDVQKLNCDFFVFSMHKLFGPFGVGVLYGKKALLEKMPPYQGGGSMIHQVKTTGVSYNDLPFKFEAGTPNIDSVIASQAAIQFFNSLDLDKVHQWENLLKDEFTSQLKKMNEIQIYGEAKNKVSIISFLLKGAHHSDIGQILDQQGIAVRAGHHCTQPLMAKLGIVGTVRASFSIYNQMADVERSVNALKKAKDLLL